MKNLFPAPAEAFGPLRTPHQLPASHRRMRELPGIPTLQGGDPQSHYEVMGDPVSHITKETPAIETSTMASLGSHALGSVGEPMSFPALALHFLCPWPL